MMRLLCITSSILPTIIIISANDPFFFPPASCIYHVVYIYDGIHIWVYFVTRAHLFTAMIRMWYIHIHKYTMLSYTHTYRYTFHHRVPPDHHLPATPSTTNKGPGKRTPEQRIKKKRSNPCPQEQTHTHTHRYTHT